MEKFFRFGLHAQDNPNYDCGASKKTMEEWKNAGEANVFLGIAFLVYGISVEFIYGLVMFVLWKIRHLNACFTIMLLLGVFDMAAVCVNSLTSGVLWIIGANFCVAPDLIYIAGCLGLGLWCGACLICLILVLNRLCDLWKQDLVEKLFGGNRLYIWILLPVIYFLSFALFTPPILFNSSAGAWFFSPMIFNTSEETSLFHNIPHTVNNLFIVFATCIVYFLLCIIIGHKYGFRGIASMKNLQKSIAFQAVVICLPNLIASIVYVYMQFFSTPYWLVIVGHICWQTGHGVPAFVYLLMNRRIRRGVARVLGMKGTTRVSYIQTRTTTSSFLSRI